MKEYVVGFAFDRSDCVLLIEKKRPEWQAGKFNGIGGSVEIGETPDDAMRREFEEEAGFKIDEWKHFCTLATVDDEIIYFYRANVLDFARAYSATDEKLIVCASDYLPKNVLPNIPWIVGMALSFERGETAEWFKIREQGIAGKRAQKDS